MAYKLIKADVLEFIEDKGLKGRKFSPKGMKVTVLPMFRNWLVLMGKSDVQGIAKLSDKNTLKMITDLIK